jgi:hypothetical protein
MPIMRATIQVINVADGIQRPKFRYSTGGIIEGDVQWNFRFWLLSGRDIGILVLLRRNRP